MIISLGSCSKQKETSQPLAPLAEVESEINFSDVTNESGIGFVCRNGQESETYSIVQTLGGGGGAFDFDHDGLMDFYLVGGGTISPELELSGLPGALFRGQNGTRFQDVTKVSGTAGGDFYSHGIAVSDFNADGFDDFLITGYQGLLLFQNQGDGTFSQVSQTTGIGQCQWGTGAAWGDFNGDGLVDLYVVQYLDWTKTNHPICRPTGTQQDVCGPEKFRGLGDVLYLNHGDGTFKDVSSQCGLRTDGKGLGVVLVDINHDGTLEIYVANDTDDNFLYLNDSTGQFKEIGIVSGTAQDDSGFANGSMGVSVLDFNHDGKADLWVTNFENDSFALYRNEGEAIFTHASGATGIFAIGSSFVGWGTITDDLDNDGTEEIVVTNGHVEAFPRSGDVAQLPIVLKKRNGTFERLPFEPSTYFGQHHLGRGLFKCDFDNDGDWDLGFCHLNEPFHLMRNETTVNRAWLGTRLIGVLSDRKAVGAKVVLIAGDEIRTQFVIGGGSYLSHSDSRLLWSLPSDTKIATLEVHWPSGTMQRIEVNEFHRYIDVTETHAD
jgi:hypothetical protein